MMKVKAMDEAILVVDDDTNFLDAIRRQLRKEFNLATAQGPHEGLAAIRNNRPYSVIISDLQMPDMNGIEFLARVKEIVPDTVRIMLTGNADLNKTIRAVNEGNIFQFLTKPCSPDTLKNVINLGIKQHRLVIAEKELLEKTLKGTVSVLNEILSLVNPVAFGRSSRIKQHVKQIAETLDLSNIWWLEMAAMLSQIGCVILPEEALKKLYRGEELSGEESQLFDMHPMIASDLLSKIPRLDKLAEIIRYQEKFFDGSGNPKDNLQGENIPIGARILKAAIDFDIMEAKGIENIKIVKQLKDLPGKYDPDVLSAMESLVGGSGKCKKTDVLFADLKTGMILDEDVRSKTGRLLISRGHEVSSVLLSRLHNFAKS
ncbi:MAG: response regulator, partial [Desulfobacterium sp.]|nr:response regulator [Desulfobacterium sp.]MBU4035163.1 response regulator [Pseudomonadota bacterium]